ncbi:hypothetical protein L3Q82_018569, partial [Scortum barcoo]
DGTLRLCVDYRLLNSKTCKDVFPLPRVEESLDALSGPHWFSTLDWLQDTTKYLSVTEKDKAKTAFCTTFGLFKWNWMPFGLCNAPSTFQRLMERIFGDQRGQSLHLDDVIFFCYCDRAYSMPGCCAASPATRRTQSQVGEVLILQARVAEGQVVVVLVTWVTVSSLSPFVCAVLP